jgi:oligopeptide/dipeptide ABC transporter ATP-binding protein
MNENGRLSLLSDISFSIRAGEIVAVIGESGSGKTLLTRSLTRLFPGREDFMVEGRVSFLGENILGMSEGKLRDLRKSSIRYVFQDPAQALNPAFTLGSQVRLLEDGCEERGAVSIESQFIENIAALGISEPRDILRKYPHQLSVGMAQRSLVAAALLGNPKLLIADEPTSAIDPAMRRRILALLALRCHERGMSLLLTTHDLDAAREYADRVIVLYAGRIVESSEKEEFFARPLHPYSQALLSSQPREGVPLNDVQVIAGEPVHAGHLPGGCAFHPRCPRVKEECRAHEPALEPVNDDRMVRCLFWK